MIRFHLAAIASILAFARLDASSISAFVEKAERREPLSVVFFGGSLTFGANASDPNVTSYRGRMMRWLRETYPATPFDFHDAAIGGSGSQLGMFRLERDVLAHKPDLVFLDFTVNDGAEETDMESLASYERIVRELLAADSAVMPVLMLFKWHAEAADPAFPPRHLAHLKLAAAYHLPVANVLLHIRGKVAGGTKPAELWNMGDGAHPGDEGYQLFFESARDAFVKAAADKTPAAMPEGTVFPDLYPKRVRHRLAETLPAGWTRRNTWRTALWFDGMASRWMDDLAATTSSSPAALELEFDGSMVGIFGERNGFTPPVKIWIDGNPVAPPKAKPGEFTWPLDTSRFSPPKKGSGNLFMWQVIARGLPDGRHKLRVEPQFPENGPESELRIESVCSAGK